MTVFKRGKTAGWLILVVHISIVNFAKTSDDFSWNLKFNNN